jgi:hypothetical protein
MRTFGIVGALAGALCLSTYLFCPSSPEKTKNAATSLVEEQIVHDHVNDYLRLMKSYIKARQEAREIVLVESRIGGDYNLADGVRADLCDDEMRTIYARVHSYLQSPDESSLDSIIGFLESNMAIISRSNKLKEDLTLFRFARQINRNYNQHEDDVSELLDDNWKNVYRRMRHSDTELGGYIAVGEDGLIINFIPDYRYRARKRYIEKVLGGIYSDMDSFPEELESDRLYNDMNLKNVVHLYLLSRKIMTIDQEQVVSCISRLGLPESKIQAAMYSFFVIKRDFGDYEMLLGKYMTSHYSVRSFLPEIIDQSNIVCHFHTHPGIEIDPDKRGPSASDHSCSNQFGNGIVFERSVGRLHVYHFRFGKKTEIRRYDASGEALSE